MEMKWFDGNLERIAANLEEFYILEEYYKNIVWDTGNVKWVDVDVDFAWQIFSDVVCEVESKERINITEEPLEKSTLRLLTSLQILKFKPETENP